jgi:hypothetical protein
VTTKIPQCKVCGVVFEDWKALAWHIHNNKKSHKKSQRFAAQVLVGVRDSRPKITRVGKDPTYEPTEYGKEQRANAVRELSGESIYENTHCPTCGKGSRILVPLEHAESDRAWRNTLGRLMVDCDGCRRKDV